MPRGAAKMQCTSAPYSLKVTKCIAPPKTPLLQSQSDLITAKRLCTHDREAIILEPCFDQRLFSEVSPLSCGFRGFRASSKYRNCHIMFSNVNLVVSRAFRRSYDFQGEERTTAFLNNPLPALRIWSTIIFEHGVLPGIFAVIAFSLRSGRSLKKHPSGRGT